MGWSPTCEVVGLALHWPQTGILKEQLFIMSAVEKALWA